MTMGWFDGIADIGKGILHGAEELGKAVAAPIEGLASAVGEGVSGLLHTLKDIWDGFFGSPTVPGGTNWNGFSHQDMYLMLHTNADAGQLGQQSGLLNNLGQAAQDCADQVRKQNDARPAHWRGQASEAAAGVLVQHQDGGDQLGTYAHSVGTVLDRAADGLSRAQNTMPKPVDSDAVTATGGAVGALAGSELSPGGMAIGTLLGAGVSKLGAWLYGAKQKAEAVRVMQQYEQSLHDAFGELKAPTTPPPGPS